ncbi:MAG: class I SAM-dependent methyltransferase [Thermoplasmata archaeon]
MVDLKENERMYGDLAWTWPIISPPEDYMSEAGQFRAAIEKYSEIPVRTVLNLGCGGGHNDFHLKEHYDITGVDISDGMLQNARELNPGVKYLKGDMRSARLGKNFDAVIIADAIMYMLSEEDLLAAFKTAFNHLNPGGVFCTYAEELRENFSRGTHCHESKSRGGMDITLIEHKWDPDPDDTQFEFMFIYIINESGKVRVETDRHTCGIFPLSAWKRLLAESGFKVKVLKLEEDGMLHFIVCKKR